MLRSESQLQEVANLPAPRQRQGDVDGRRFGDQTRENVGDLDALGGEDAVERLRVSRGWQRRAVIDECVDELLSGRRIMQKDNQIVLGNGGPCLGMEASEVTLRYARRSCQSFENRDAALEFALDVASHRLGDLVHPLLKLHTFGLRHPENQIATGRNHREDGEHPINQQEREQ